MKCRQLFRISWMMLFASLLSFTACEDDEVTDVPSVALPTENMTYGKFEAEPMAKYAAKFSTNDPSAEFASIEFLGDNTYVITPQGLSPAVAKAVRVSCVRGEFGFKFTKRSPRRLGRNNYADPYIRGTYTVDQNNHYVLDNKDVCEVSPQPDGQYVLTYTHRETGRTSTVYCDKATAIADKASLSLCRTWRHKASHSWSYVNGIEAYYERVDGSDYGELREVTFTPYGTYICIYNDGEIDQSTWQWEDANKGILFYDWQDETEPDAEGFVTVRFAGNEARFYEDYNYGREEALENGFIDADDLAYIEDEYGTIKTVRSLCVTELVAKFGDSGSTGEELDTIPPTPEPPTTDTLDTWVEGYGAWGYAGTKLMEINEHTITFYDLQGNSETTRYKLEDNRIYYWVEEGDGSWTHSYDKILTLTKDLFIAQEYEENVDGLITPGQIYSYFRLPQEPNVVGPLSLLYEKSWLTVMDGEYGKMYVYPDGRLYLDGVECQYVYNDVTHELTLTADGETEVFRIVKLTDRIVYFDVMVNGHVDDKLEYRILD